MESIDFFVLHENAESENISSDHRFPFNQRRVDNRFFGIPFKLLPQATTTVFLRSSSEKRHFLNLMWKITTVGTSL
jgi:hypothetical protein